MISRRSIRIKVLQALYSQVLHDNNDAKAAIEIYDKSIKEVVEVNLVYLLYAKEILGYVETYAAQQGGKYLITEKEKYVNVDLLKSDFYAFLTNNLDFQKAIKKYKIEQYIQSEFVRAMFFELMKLKEYELFLKDLTKENESNLMQAFCKRILFRNEDLKNYLEAYYANIEEDSDLVHFTLRRCFRSMVDKGTLVISLGFDEMKSLESFAYNLIKVTLKNQGDYMKIIEPKLIGWDADRIPILDLMLVKLAMSEMLHFELIPLKVTVNEYIDLAKMFCSVKSKDFINGIMDRIMKEFQAEGKINKKGRGLE